MSDTVEDTKGKKYTAADPKNYSNDSLLIFFG